MTLHFDTTFLIILRLLLRFGKNIWKWVVLYVKKPFAVISCTVLVKKAFTVCQSLFTMVSKFEKAHGHSEIRTDLKTHFHSSLSKYSKDKKKKFCISYRFFTQIVKRTYLLLFVTYSLPLQQNENLHILETCQPCKK